MGAVDYLEPEEVRRFLAKAEEAGPRDELMCRILLYTGMRIGELSPLTVGDVDIRRRAITLSKVITTPHHLGVQETHGGAKREGTNPKTGRAYSDRPNYNPRKDIAILLCDEKRTRLTGDRAVGTPAELQKRFPSGELVKDGLKARHPARVVPLTDRVTLSTLEEWIRGRNRNDFLWISQKGGRMNTVRIYHKIKEIMLASGIPEEKAHPHNLRHTFAVHFLKRTRDLPRLQRLLGHSSIVTTTIYLRFAFEDLRDAMDQAGDLFREDF